MYDSHRLQESERDSERRRGNVTGGKKGSARRDRRSHSGRYEMERRTNTDAIEGGEKKSGRGKKKGKKKRRAERAIARAPGQRGEPRLVMHETHYFYLAACTAESGAELQSIFCLPYPPSLAVLRGMRTRETGGGSGGAAKNERVIESGKGDTHYTGVRDRDETYPTLRALFQATPPPQVSSHTTLCVFGRFGARGLIMEPGNLLWRYAPFWSIPETIQAYTYVLYLMYTGYTRTASGQRTE